MLVLGLGLWLVVGLDYRVAISADPHIRRSAFYPSPAELAQFG